MFFYPHSLLSNVSYGELILLQKADEKSIAVVCVIIRIYWYVMYIRWGRWMMAAAVLEH